MCHDSAQSDPVFPLPDRFTADARDRLRRALLDWVDDAVGRGVPRLVVDASATEEIDLHGVSLLLVLQRRAVDHGVRLVLRRPRGQVSQMIVTSGLASLFDIEI
jgi:anti-anti-sigma regulatory factor